MKDAFSHGFVIGWFGAVLAFVGTFVFVEFLNRRK